MCFSIFTPKPFTDLTWNLLIAFSLDSLFLIDSITTLIVSGMCMHWYLLLLAIKSKWLCVLTPHYRCNTDLRYNGTRGWIIRNNATVVVCSENLHQFYFKNMMQSIKLCQAIWWLWLGGAAGIASVVIVKTRTRNIDNKLMVPNTSSLWYTWMHKQEIHGNNYRQKKRSNTICFTYMVFKWFWKYNQIICL